MTGYLGCYAGLKFWICWSELEIFYEKADKGQRGGGNEEEFEGMFDGNNF